ncbi:GDSL-type esterase/lipase family protein [Aeromonas hydrophila]|uniref:GDSL-type esterase/lipase family protein n=1 Tax=Aeromonas hydrophila TaxID=644 RepID=UPI0002D2CD28|nr:GDSL-type esterase/lipase family protein [Aeromonas hydrophila]
MYWPDTGTGVDVQPTRKPVVSAIRQYFTEGGLGQVPTVPGGDWFNTVTNELIAILEMMGVSPDKADDDQIATALSEWMVSKNVNLRHIWERSIFDQGLTLVAGSFEEGATITSSTQAIWFETEGQCYTWLGTIPSGGLVIPPNSTPEDTGGISPAGNWLSVGLGTRQEMNIYTFKGADDYDGATGTNNFNAVSAYMTHLRAVGGAARFPKTGTGVYFIDGFSEAVDLSGIEMVVDEGVSFHIAGTWTELITKGLKVNRELPLRIGSQQYTFYHGMHQYRKPSEVMPSLLQTDGSVEIPETIQGSYFTGYRLEAGRAALSLSSTVDTVTVPLSATSQVGVAAIPCKIGDEIGCYCAATTGRLMFGVLTPNGRSVVIQNLADQVTVLDKNGALSTINLPTPYQNTRSQFNSALMSVRMITNRKFSVHVNEVSLGVFDAGEPISAICFGADNRTSAVTFGGLFKLTNSRMSGARPLRLIALGDSTSDADVPCSQLDYMKQFLATAGCQVYELNNLAESGDTSTAQRARFEAVGISAYDICIAQLGINDIQGAIPVATFIANMEAIADRCNANGVKLIVGLPTTWYSAAEAAPYGQTGFDAHNDASAAPYKASLIRSMAAKGAMITSSPPKMQGVISAKWLSIAGADSVLMDNIHPTAYGRMMMGMGTAMAVMGAINPVSMRQSGATTLPARWAAAFATGATEFPSISIENGCLSFSGGLAITSIPANGTVLFNPDKELSNGRYQFFSLPAQSAAGPVGFCNLAIDPNGQMTIYAVPAGTVRIPFDGVFITK